MTEPPKPPPNVFSLVDRRARLDAEDETQRLKDENATLRQRIAESSQMIISAKVSRHSKETCHWHGRVVVDERSPLVECADCGTELDPYVVLLELANGERTFRHWVESYKTEKIALERAVAALKAQKSKLAREVRQLGGKPEVR